MESKKFYPDIALNKSKKLKYLSLLLLFLFFVGGTAIVIALGKNSKSYVMAGSLGIIIIFIIALIPSVIKQYPTKQVALIEISPKEVKVQNETVKISDISKVRMTISLNSVGKKDENMKFIKETAAKKPEEGLTGDLDFVIRQKNGKDKVLYSTISNCPEALTTLYKLGLKHYEILYSLGKLSELSTFRLEETLTEDGKKLSDISKKDRVKQLF